jgi:hypothetical protein
MGDIGSDTLAELEMLIDAYKDLRAKKPQHELLSMVQLHPDERGFTMNAAYFQRCVRDTDRECIQGYARYRLALENAINGNPHRLLDTNPPCEF